MASKNQSKNMNSTNLFGFSIFAGIASIFLGTYFSNWILNIAIPIAIMLFYSWKINKDASDTLSIEQKADSVYYMGFILTLVAMTSSLVALAYDDALQFNAIVINFGLALATTILDLAIRIMWLQLSSQDLADAEANLENQSHSISFLISEMANLQLPVIGIVFGGGYSGGAIPLATANILLSVREGVFNTIHPKGLSNIARKYDLSWQESAKHIGVSAYELQSQGYFDGIIDYSYDQPQKVKNIKDAIVSSIEITEKNSCKFLYENDFFFDHYRDSIYHYLNPSKLLIESNRATDRSPTGTLNIFGDVYRFMRCNIAQILMNSVQFENNFKKLSNVKSDQ